MPLVVEQLDRLLDRAWGFLFLHSGRDRNVGSRGQNSMFSSPLPGAAAARLQIQFVFHVADCAAISINRYPLADVPGIS